MALKSVADDLTLEYLNVKNPRSSDDFSWTLVTPTFGSATSEAITYAAADACSALAKKLQPYKQDTWMDTVTAAGKAGVDLSAKGEHPRLKGNFGYHIYVATCVYAEIDVLTGETEILSADIVQDAGKSLNPAVDIGQIEGCFIQALGFCLTEEQVWSGVDGRMVNKGTWDYKIPSARDIPIQMNVTLKPGTNQTWGNVMGSKATGEPTMLAGGVTFFAVKDAIYAARKEAGKTGYFQLSGPASPQNIQTACLVNLCNE